MQTLQEAFGLQHPVGQTPIHQLTEDRQGYIWIISHELGVFRFDPQTNHISLFFPPDNAIQSSCVAGDGRIWIASLNEVFLFDAKAGLFRPLQIRKQLGTQSLIRSILFDQAQHLWIATSDDGAFMLDGAKVIHFEEGKTANHLSSSDVGTLMCDRAGQVWLGTRTGGICIYHPQTRQFSYVRHTPHIPRSLSDNFIGQLYQDEQGMVWIGTGSQGFDKYDPHRFPFGLISQTTDPHHQSLPDNMIFRLFGQGETLYIGTEAGGATRYSIATQQVRPFPKVITAKVSAMRDETRVIVADSDHALWLPTGANSPGMTLSVNPFGSIRWQAPADSSMYLGRRCLPIRRAAQPKSGFCGPGGLTRFDIRAKQWKAGRIARNPCYFGA